jgi:hypothetical protein
MMGLFKAEKAASSLVLANITLEGVAKYLTKLAPFLSTLLILLQIAVAAFTVWHFLRRWVVDRKLAREKTTPTDSTGSDI